MRSVKFKKVLHDIAGKVGMLDESGNVGEINRGLLVPHINDRVSEGWEYGFWPEWTVVERRAFRNAWVNTTTYATDDEIYRNDGTNEGYYISQLDSNTGNDPLTDDGTNWVEIEDLEKYISYEQLSETKLGEVKSVSLRNPLTSANPCYLNFTMSNVGIQLTPDSLADNRDRKSVV